MAIDFNRSVNELVRDLQRRGMHPRIVSQSSERPIRAAEIRVLQNLHVHWDRESRSVWVEGPRAEAMRIEAYLQRRFHGGWFTRTAAKFSTTIGVQVSEFIRPHEVGS